ncbi:replication protein A 70 kDa DNA-binding subunit D [Capsicum annuum]
MKDRKPFDCPKCLQKMSLVPRCMFQIDLTDATGSTIALISGALGEKILSMTAEDIFDTTCVKLQLLRLDYIHQMLSNKLFNIQLKKSSWVSDNVTRTSLTIVLVTENEQVLPLAIDQRIAKKVRPLATSEQEMEPRIVESGSSSATLALEPLMPAKITKGLRT